ncbi:MAG: RagB/SusD family nutrient uptake outer membrane protein [Bacteroidales bacterium]|nr:RagB/SusD family nutrient uptake outer membrane protein [Bacteroidales bacterium]
MKTIIYIISFVLAVLMTSCEFVEPEQDNTLFEDELLASPALSEGFLIMAYQNMPTYYDITDIATDNAVSNSLFSDYRKMATGEWSSQFYPLSKWGEYNEVAHLNKFLSIVDEVKWSLNDEELNAMHKVRLKGEAHGLRAWYMFQIIQAHAGPSTDGTIMGVPMVTEVLNAADEPVIERSTFDDCIAQIISDVDVAISNLPGNYKQITDADSNASFGDHWENRMDGTAARALKSRILLFAASPAFTEGKSNVQDLWEDAATTTGQLIFDKGGLTALGSSYNKFWLDEKDADIIWRRQMDQNNSFEYEELNFPPSLYGKGETNPSQNLVDAFPDNAGFPISLSTTYDPGNPYSGRDNRLSEYIVHNDGSFKVGTIVTHKDTTDGINELTTSTRTGYYMKKLLSQSVKLDPENKTKANHIFPYFRYTEVFLNYAEAANEAWGPQQDPNGYGVTAYSVMEAIRARAGIVQPDAYLQSIGNDKDAIRTLIQNERRLELCFEGFRFWDLRRWKSDATFETVYGMSITKTGTDYTYERIEVETRPFKDYMMYGPIPYYETLKYDNLSQNAGWK